MEIGAVYLYNSVVTFGCGNTYDLDFTKPLETSFLQKYNPNVIVYLANRDGYCIDEEPSIPIVWGLYEDGHKPVIWGEVVLLGKEYPSIEDCKNYIATFVKNHPGCVLKHFYCPPEDMDENEEPFPDNFEDVAKVSENWFCTGFDKIEEKYRGRKSIGFEYEPYDDQLSANIYFAGQEILSVMIAGH